MHANGWFLDESQMLWKRWWYDEVVETISALELYRWRKAMRV